MRLVTRRTIRCQEENAKGRLSMLSMGYTILSWLVLKPGSKRDWDIRFRSGLLHSAIDFVVVLLPVRQCQGSSSFSQTLVEIQHVGGPSLPEGGNPDGRDQMQLVS